MLKRVAVVGVSAQNVSRAAHFYRDVLGLRLLQHHAGPPHLQVGDLYLAVFERAILETESKTPLMAFEVDDLDTAMAALAARGVVFEDGIHQDGEAQWATFYDTEGNLLELVQFLGEPV
jgi:catechol 2,3-dioxygenase-like lactoylglutathione lyase family enzyme